MMQQPDKKTEETLEKSEGEVDLTVGTEIEETPVVELKNE